MRLARVKRYRDTQDKKRFEPTFRFFRWSVKNKNVKQIDIFKNKQIRTALLFTRHAGQNLSNFLIGQVTFINEIKVLILLQYANVDY